jgi:hypothetical protein
MAANEQPDGRKKSQEEAKRLVMPPRPLPILRLDRSIDRHKEGHRKGRKKKEEKKDKLRWEVSLARPVTEKEVEAAEEKISKGQEA